MDWFWSNYGLWFMIDDRQKFGVHSSMLGCLSEWLDGRLVSWCPGLMAGKSLESVAAL